MPVTHRVEEHTGLAIVTCSGVLGKEEAQEAATRLWNLDGWPGRCAIWDFRESQFQLTSDEIKTVARFILDNQPESAPERMAFVTPSDVDFGLARMFEAFREDAKTAFRVFRDFDEAVQWASRE